MGQMLKGPSSQQLRPRPHTPSPPGNVNSPFRSRLEQVLAWLERKPRCALASGKPRSRHLFPAEAFEALGLQRMPSAAEGYNGVAHPADQHPPGEM